MEAGEELARLDAQVLSFVLEADLAFGLLSSKQHGISHTE